tara:strand:+ start:413 stop:664 length:252 start_codon:yes stop_codon:yes gene_type:complete
MEEFKTSLCIIDDSGTLNGALSSSKTMKEISFALEVIASDIDMFEIFSRLFARGILEESNKEEVADNTPTGAVAALRSRRPWP